MLSFSGTFVMQVLTRFPSRNISHEEHVPCLHWKLNRMPDLTAAKESGDPELIFIFWLLSIFVTST
jgi:hypothetical protein